MGVCSESQPAFLRRHNLLFIIKVKAKVTRSYLTLQSMDCSPPGSSVHGILQARHLEWVAISSVYNIHHKYPVIGRTDVEAETPVLWPPDVKSWLIWQDPDSGKDWRQEEKGRTEDETVGWHQRLNGHEFGLNSGVHDGQGGLVCSGSWGHKESDMTEWLNWTELNFDILVIRPLMMDFLSL